MDIKELDVLSLQNGQKVTVLEICHRRDGSREYLVEDATNESFCVTEKDIAKVEWRLPRGEKASA